MFFSLFVVKCCSYLLQIKRIAVKNSNYLKNQLFIKANIEKWFPYNVLLQQTAIKSGLEHSNDVNVDK